MKFFSDNAAPVHPAIWKAMQAADATDSAYAGDGLSARLDAVLGELFGTKVGVLWTSTGTAANCLALSALVQSHGSIICHKESHLEVDECGAPSWFTGGAKLRLAEGDGAKLTPESVAAVTAELRGDVHQSPAQAISIAQATEYGRVYAAAEVKALGDYAGAHRMRLHMDGARFANAIATLGCHPGDVTWRAGVDALSFGFIKNGGMGGEALVFFDPALAEATRYRHKSAGQLQSKGRFLAAQILAMVETIENGEPLWLANARRANAAAQLIADAASARLIQPVEANEVFIWLDGGEATSLRAQGFDFYDWGRGAARLVTSWASSEADVAALAAALGAL